MGIHLSLTLATGSTDFSTVPIHFAGASTGPPPHRSGRSRASGAAADISLGRSAIITRPRHHRRRRPLPRCSPGGTLAPPSTANASASFTRLHNSTSLPSPPLHRVRILWTSSSTPITCTVAAHGANTFCSAARALKTRQGQCQIKTTTAHGKEPTSPAGACANHPPSSMANMGLANTATRLPLPRRHALANRHAFRANEQRHLP